MVIQFTLQNLMLFLLCAVGIAAGILLIPILWNMKKAVSIFQSLLETNQEIINKAIHTMPGIIQNVEKISINLSETTYMLKVSTPLILQEVEYVTSAAKGSIELASGVMENIGSGFNETVAAYTKDTPDYMAYFHIIEEVVQLIYRTFFSSK